MLSATKPLETRLKGLECTYLNGVQVDGNRFENLFGGTETGLRMCLNELKRIENVLEGIERG